MFGFMNLTLLSKEVISLLWILILLVNKDSLLSSYRAIAKKTVMRFMIIFDGEMRLARPSSYSVAFVATLYHFAYFHNMLQLFWSVLTTID